jgi:5'-3' exonuclease
MKVHLVDGTFELFRCFHGAPRAKSAGGVEVGGVRGLLHTLVALLREPDVTHVAVAVDQALAPPRSELGSGDDGLLASQHGLAADAIRALGLPIWPMVKRWQADDALATAACRFAREAAVDQVVVCSPDKDLAQVVSGERIVLRDRVRKKTYDEPAVRERWGVAPAAIPDLLALAGDAADGLPGLPGWGMKSAAALLRRFGSLDAIPLDAALWDVPVRGADRLARELRDRRHEALLYRELTRLSLEVPLAESLDDLLWRGAPRERFEAFCAEIGEREVLERVPRWR